jgi:2-amino-4-hydroxy-6-hydroxymethyldihydropteridine diphosphokinase
MSEQHLVFLAMGTNLGNREKNLSLALNALSSEVEIIAVSRLYETAPAYVLDQPTFLNIAVEGQTGLSPVELLALLKRIEESVGREQRIRYGPREIDIDIVFYDDVILNLSNLQIPHPRLAERGFVLRPLADIAADIVHPIEKQTIAELVAKLPSDDGILKVTEWQPI